ncbi:hypothetical protein [Streptomyces chartreusis]
MAHEHPLIPLYRDSDHTRVRFTGGPHDGETRTLSTGTPPPLIRLPHAPQPLGPVEIAAYKPSLDEHYLTKRDDDGTLVYEYIDSHISG